MRFCRTWPILDAGLQLVQLPSGRDKLQQKVLREFDRGAESPLQLRTYPLASLRQQWHHLSFSLLSKVHPNNVL
jgi:hypothetical protein